MTFARRIVTAENWADALTLLRPAMEKEGGDPEVIYGDLVSHRAQLWANEDWSIGCLTETAGEAVRLYLVSGSGLGGWMAELEAVIAAGAREAGFKSIESVGRKAWVRLLAPCGYEPVAIMLRKRL